MSKLLFQSKILVQDAIDINGVDEWRLTFVVEDNEGVFSNDSVKVGDIIVLNTGSVETGTLTYYELISIVSINFANVVVNIKYMDINDNDWPNPDLSTTLDQYGVITRPSENKGLMPVVSPRVQQISDIFSFYVNNVNLNDIVDKIETSDVDPTEPVEGKTINGAVFITDIEPQDSNENVGEKVYSEDNTTLVSCATTSDKIRVKVLAITGHTRFKPIVKIGEEEVPLNPLMDAPLFEGWINIDLPTDGIVKVVHEDGAEWITTVTLDAAPVILSTYFLGNYPNEQTEYKENDTVSLSINTDVPVVGYEIRNYGALKASSGGFPESNEIIINNRSIANRGNTTSTASFQIRVRKANGAWSDWVDSNAFGNENHINVVRINNLHPTITVNNVIYPEGQTALKGNESAIVNHTVTNFDEIQYNSTQLNVENNNVYESNKVVTRQSGDYNNSSNNLTISAIRKANGAVRNVNTLVSISNVEPTINITLPQARLRSGGNNGTSVQNYVVTITSSQALLEAPTLNAPEGTWLGSGFVGNAAKTVWTRSIAIHDDNAKGSFSWNSLVAKSLSGLLQTTINNGLNYVIGGFVFRQLQVSAFPNREAAIGTVVSDVSKLRCSNLSKGSSGSLNFTYQDSISEAVNKFTITGPSGIQNANGDLWYNCDGANASSNTTGEMLIEIEEVV